MVNSIYLPPCLTPGLPGRLLPSSPLESPQRLCSKRQNFGNLSVRESDRATAAAPCPPGGASKPITKRKRKQKVGSEGDRRGVLP